MGLVMAALSNTSFLCGAIVVTGIIAMASDLLSKGFTFHFWDISDVFLVLLAGRYLHLAKADQWEPCIQGMLCVLVMMLSIMYVFG